MRVITLLLGLILLCACGAGDDAGVTDARSKNIPNYNTPSALTLTPNLDVSGVEDVFAELDVTTLSFDAEVYVLPIESNEFFGGDSVSISFELRADGETVITPTRDLRLGASGAYRVLLRLRQAADGVTLDLGGLVRGPIIWELNETFHEPAPTAARDGKMDVEPAPTAASEKCEPAPTAADDGDSEATDHDPDMACEPAPTAADDADDSADLEPAPTAAQADDEMAGEAAPTAAEPAPTAAREKKTKIESFEIASDGSEDASLKISSKLEVEFYAGIADVEAGDSTLVVRWDMRHWLRSLLSEPLGIDPSQAPLAEIETPSEGQFVDSPGAFELETF